VPWKGIAAKADHTEPLPLSSLPEGTVGRRNALAGFRVVLGCLVLLSAVVGSMTIGVAQGAVAAVPASTSVPIGPAVVEGITPFRAAPGGAAAVRRNAVAPTTHLTIVPIYDSSVTTSPQAAEIEAGFAYAAGQFEAEYSDPITVDINVSDTGIGPGQSDDYLSCPGYSDLRDALVAAAITSDQVTAAGYLPATDPTGGGSDTRWCATLPDLMALGLLPADCFAISPCNM
jgi:hypothetical protein